MEFGRREYFLGRYQSTGGLFKLERKYFALPNDDVRQLSRNGRGVFGKILGAGFWTAAELVVFIFVCKLTHLIILK